MRLLLMVFLLALAMPALAEIKLEPIDYEHEGTKLQGWLAYDDTLTSKRPGVVVVHQWMGITDHEKTRAKRLAEAGYVAFVADIYGVDVKVTNQGEAGKQAGKYKGDRALLRGRVNAALNTLKSQSRVDPTRLGAIGFCFGGTTVLELARSGADVKGVVSFHGGLGTPTPDDAKNIKGSVLVLHGADDPHSDKKEVDAFTDEMRAAKVDYEVVLYGNAVHSFTEKGAGNDNSKGAAYNEKADKRSWEKMKSFFREVFGE